MDTRIIESAEGMHEFAVASCAEGRRLALVPTMGSLHNGHLKLVEKAREVADAVVVSLFVNPSQFESPKQFDQYPRDLPGDLEKLHEAGVEVAFVPEVETFWPMSRQSFVDVSQRGLGLSSLHLLSRFRGSVTATAMLLNVVRPVALVLAEKNFHHLAMVRRMVRELCYPVSVETIEAVRDPHGVALDPLLGRLNEEERRQAAGLYDALKQLALMVRKGEHNGKTLVDLGRAALESEAPAARVEYFDVIDKESLRPLDEVKGEAVISGILAFPTARLSDSISV